MNDRSCPERLVTQGLQHLAHTPGHLATLLPALRIVLPSAGRVRETSTGAGGLGRGFRALGPRTDCAQSPCAEAEPASAPSLLPAAPARPAWAARLAPRDPARPAPPSRPGAGPRPLLREGPRPLPGAGAGLPARRRAGRLRPDGARRPDRAGGRAEPGPRGCCGAIGQEAAGRRHGEGWLEGPGRRVPGAHSARPTEEGRGRRGPRARAGRLGRPGWGSLRRGGATLGEGSGRVCSGGRARRAGSLSAALRRDQDKGGGGEADGSRLCESSVPPPTTGMVLSTAHQVQLPGWPAGLPLRHRDFQKLTGGRGSGGLQGGQRIGAGERGLATSGARRTVKRGPGCDVECRWFHRRPCSV